MEIQILELQKLSQDQKDGNGLINWMRFLGGKNRREFEEMAKTDEYIGEAYRELEKLSADEKAKLEYEAREKAIRDYNSQMSSALRRGMQRGMEKGMEQGMKQGMQQGIEQGRQDMIVHMLQSGAAPEEIILMTGAEPEEVKKAAEAAGVKASS